MSTVIVIALIFSGILVGFVNTLAGGGTIISLSLLMALGLPPTVANGTNRIAVFFQTITSTQSFNKHKILDIKKGLWLGIPTTIGSIAGALLAVDVDEKLFKMAMVLIMFIMVFFLFYKPERWLLGKRDLLSRKLDLKLVLIFTLIGFYGGFIHVGVGYFLIGALVLGLGYDLVKANALKVFIVLLYVPFSLLIFIINDQVYYLYGFIHAIGNVLGAYIASKYAIEKGANFVRWVIVIVVILTAFNVFGWIDLTSWFDFIKK
jgi:uncharacterized protein